MKTFEAMYGKVTEQEIWMAVTSMVLGVGVLTLPRQMAEVTHDADGWVSIIAAGIVLIVFAWIAAKLASSFPGMSFTDYAAQLVGRSAAVVLTCLFALSFLLVAAFEVSALSKIAMQYLFVRTPIEIIALTFLLTVVYAVAGSRVALLRLNVLFTPVVLLIVLLVMGLNLGYAEVGNLKPFLTTSWTGYMRGFNETLMSLAGFHILLFYVSLMDRPKRAPKMAIKGMIFPVIAYLIIYIMAIAMFGQTTARDMAYPTIEMAKEVHVPGEFFERFESLFFTIWIMTIFNTTVMSYDLVIMSLSSVFKSIRKITWVLILAPVIMVLSMLPETTMELNAFGTLISLSGIFFGVVVPTVLFIIARWRGVSANE